MIFNNYILSKGEKCGIMIKNVCKGMKLSMGTKNGIISTALLSLLFEKSRKDNLDLMRPFVECAICEKYSINDRIDISIIASHLEAEFGFENVVDSHVCGDLLILERKIQDKNNLQVYINFVRIYYYEL